METTWNPPMSAEERQCDEAEWAEYDRLCAQIAALPVTPWEDAEVSARHKAEMAARQAELAVSQKRTAHVWERATLWNSLNLLDEPQFEAVVQRLQPPVGVDPGPKMDQMPRTSSLLRWADDTSGPGIAALRAALEQVAGSENHHS